MKVYFYRGLSGVIYMSPLDLNAAKNPLFDSPIKIDPEDSFYPIAEEFLMKHVCHSSFLSSDEPGSFEL